MINKLKNFIAYTLIVAIVSVMTQSMVTYAAALAGAAAPQVTLVTPNGDAAVKVATGKVTFDMPMDISTLTRENIIVTDASNGNAVVEQIKASSYNDEYVFVCNFETDTTYKVTISTNVKSAAGVALQEEYVHTFTTGDILTETENVTPDNSDSYRHNLTGEFDGTRRSMDILYDGDISSYLYTYGSISPKWITIDLGKPVDIAYISFVMKGPDASAIWPSDTKILASKNVEFSDAVTLCVTPTVTEYIAKSTVEWNIAPKGTGEKYRYIRITKQSVNMCASEIDIYGYISSPEIISVSPSGDEVFKAAVGNITFDMPMDKSTLNSDNIVVTDTESGLEIEQKKVSVYDNEYTFICDFEPLKEYQISVSTNVKSADGVVMSANYQNTFKTAEILYETLDVTPKQETSYTYQAESTSGGVPAVYDGNIETIWNTYGSMSSSYLQADLGELKNIAYISYHGKRSTDSDTFLNDVKIQVSKNADFSEYNEINVLPVFTEGNSGTMEWIAAVDNDEQYQYIRIAKDSSVMYVTELTIYSYKVINFIKPVPRNIGLHKPLSYNENIGIYGSGVLSGVNDGETSAYVAFNPANSSANEMSWFRFDLLKPYDIEKINIFTRNVKGDTDNMTIYGSNEIVPVSEMDVLYECPAGLPVNQKSEIPINADSSYRYITFQKIANGHFVVCEVEIISSEDTNYKSDWSITQNEASYEATLSDIDYQGVGKTVNALVLGHNENGELSYLKTKEFALEHGENDITINDVKPAGTGNVYVTLLDGDMQNFKVALRPKAVNTNAVGTERAIEELSGEEVALHIILKQGVTFNDQISQSDIVFMDMKMADEEGKAKFSYDFKTADGIGKFNARTYITHADGSTSSKDYAYYHYTAEAIDNMVKDFKNNVSDNTSFKTKLNYYTEVEPYFDLEEIPELNNDAIQQNIGEFFIQVRDLYLKESGNTEENIINALKTAYVWYSMYNGSDEQVLSKYGDMIASFNQEKHDEVKVLEMIKRIKDGVTDGTSFTKACSNACLYSMIFNTNTETIAEALKTYANGFGIDLKYAEDKKVAIADVAEQIDTVNPEKYIGIMKSTFEGIVDEIFGKRGTIGSRPVVGGGTGGVSMAVGNTSSQTQGEGTVQTGNETIAFADTMHLDWAKDAIGYLANHNIVSGVDGVNFMPEKNITREEFSKMIFLAFDIDEGEDSATSFVDCKKENWFYPYVDALLNSGIINGISNEHFGVGMQISRQDAATILNRILVLYKKGITPDEISYQDGDTISSYARQAVERLDKAAIITGFEDGTFRPHDVITRAQAAVMIYRAIQFVGA